MRNDGSESPLSWHKKGKVNPTSYLTTRINLLQAEISDVTHLVQTLRDDVQYWLEEAQASVEKSTRHIRRDFENALN